MGAPADWPTGEKRGANAPRNSKFNVPLKTTLSPRLQGVAIFACGAHGLCETLETGAAFQNQRAFEPSPDLFQLAHLLDEHARERAGGKWNAGNA